NPELISNYRQRQERILLNIISRLKTDAVLVYITCSVFADENERISAKLLSYGNIKLEQQELIGGYRLGADSMYVARFTKIT
ncbi:MAG TPA: hypothetical protein VK588_11755, partial [Chitinophagaceae bacterium]|nr:hypothetical protein [Chitinophagaceae bacterium]